MPFELTLTRAIAQQSPLRIHPWQRQQCRSRQPRNRHRRNDGKQHRRPPIHRSNCSAGSVRIFPMANGHSTPATSSSFYQRHQQRWQWQLSCPHHTTRWRNDQLRSSPPCPPEMARHRCRWRSSKNDGNGKTATPAYWSPPSRLQNDGSTVAIGGLRNDANGTNAGHVRVFSIADITAPTFSSAATSTDGTKVVLTYDEALWPQQLPPLTSQSQQVAAPIPSPPLPSPAIPPLSSRSPTPLKTIRPSPLPTPIHPAPTTPMPFKTAKAMTLHR